MIRNLLLSTVIASGLLLSFAQTVVAQEVHNDVRAVLSAEVVAVEAEEERRIIGTSASTTVQMITVEITEGERTGERVTFENDLIVLKPGDDVYVTHVVTFNENEFYYLQDIDRSQSLIVLVGLFIVLLISFVGWQGVRALASLLVSIGAILFVLIPLMLQGYNPVLVSLVVAGIILAVVLFGTHGVNARSVTAFLGTWSAVLVTSIIAFMFVSSMRLTGFGSDASVTLNFATDGQLDFVGLLLGSIIIGILGVLDDVSITQASVVQQLRAANTSLSVLSLYQRAIQVGKDHIGSLVNTLALAYVGVALPLILLFATSEAAVTMSLNHEVIAAEILRIIVGSIGLILAVPLTTIAAAWWFGTHEVDEQDISSCGHHHH